MRIVYNYSILLRSEKNCALLVMINHKFIVAGCCSQGIHGIQNKTGWQWTYCLMRQKHCWSYFALAWHDWLKWLQ